MHPFTFRHAVLPAALVLIGLLHAANAQDNAKSIFFPTDATIKSTMRGHVHVGYASKRNFNKRTGTSPTITLVNGGKISDGLDACNSSKIIVSGGSIGDLLAFNNSTVTISGSSIVHGLGARDNSTVNVKGGSIVKGIVVAGNSKITVSGGNIGDLLLALGKSTVNIKGGNIEKDLIVGDNSTLNMYGTGLSKTLTDAKAEKGLFSKYALSGNLSDGTSLNSKFLMVKNGDHPKINMVNSNVVPAEHQDGSAR